MSELVKIETGLLPTEPDQYGGSGLEDVKVSPGYIKLVHPTTTSPEGMGVRFKPGDWIDAETGDVVGSHEFVPLAIKTSRAYFPPGEVTKKFLCKSLDGITPAAFVETPMNDKCATCQYSVWQKSASGKNVPPPCSLQKTLICLDLVSNLPVKIQFSKSGLQVLEDFLKSLRRRQLSLLATGRPTADLYSFKFTLSSVKAKNAAAYIPIITYAGDSGDDLMYREMSITLNRLDAQEKTQQVTSDGLTDSEIINVEEV